MSTLSDVALQAPRRFAPLPAPPHDPYSLLLAAWVGPQAAVGWRVQALADVELSAAACALVLCPAPSAERHAAEACGSLGGLRLPINVCAGPRGELLLLDPVSGELKLYDACDGVFKPLRCTVRGARPAPADACLSPVGAAPRAPANQLLDAQALACCGDTLCIADAGHGRVLRFGLRGWLPRGELRLPAVQRAALTRPWAPGSLAFDGHGRLHVSDAWNQRIDHFDARGRWEHSFATPRPVQHIAIDGEGRLYALLAEAGPVAVRGTGAAVFWQWQDEPTAQPPALWRFDPEGAAPVALALRSDQLAGLFAPLPVAVDALGGLRLPCPRGEGGSALFDARGACVDPSQQVLAPLYRRQGRYRSQALDSSIDACQWHRVELRGCIPAGCKVELRTLSADVLLDESELAVLGDAAWSAPVSAVGMDRNGRWDALIRSLPGRYLWLRLDLSGDGFDTPQLCAALVEYPRISLRRYLPAVFGAEPVSADFTDRFTAIFDASLRSIEARLDQAAALFEPLSTPAMGLKGRVDFLSWLASWIGLAIERDWPEARRRRYLSEAAALYPLRGTPQGLRRQLLLLLGLDRAAAYCPAERPQTRGLPLPRNCGPGPARVPAAAPALVLEHFKLRRWLFAGRSRLGDDAVLWGQRIVNRSQLGDGARAGQTQLIATPDPLHDPLLVHANRISVFVPAGVRERPADERALRGLLATEVPAHVQAELVYVEPRFRVGVQAMVGLDSVIARTPQGVWLGAAGDDASPRLGRSTVLAARVPDRLALGRTRVGGPAGLA